MGVGEFEPGQNPEGFELLPLIVLSVILCDVSHFIFSLKSFDLYHRLPNYACTQSHARTRLSLCSHAVARTHAIIYLIYNYPNRQSRACVLLRASIVGRPMFIYYKMFVGHKQHSKQTISKYVYVIVQSPRNS